MCGRLEQTRFGAEGRVFRPMDFNTFPPDCWGYVLRNDDARGDFRRYAAPGFDRETGSRDDHIRATIVALERQGFTGRRITSATAPIYYDEFRIAFRVGPIERVNIDGQYRYVGTWHIIYQLSNGRWASKNGHWESLYRSHSESSRLWADRRHPITGRVQREFPGNNIYIAARPLRGWQ